MREVYQTPAIPYEAATNCELPESEIPGNCHQCGGLVVPFEGRFSMDAGYGLVFHVTEKSGLCRTCFDTMREKREQKGPPDYEFRAIRKVGKTTGRDGIEHEIYEDDPYEDYLKAVK